MVWNDKKDKMLKEIAAEGVMRKKIQVYRQGSFLGKCGE